MAATPLLLPMAERLGRATLRLRGARTHWVQTPQGSLHVYDVHGRGTLPGAVLLHGLGSGAIAYAPLVLRLRAQLRRILAPDFPGHGFSPRPPAPLTANGLVASVGAALDALIEEPAIVVGNSLGGGVALRYALDRPERVRALVLVSPAGARTGEGDLRAIKAAFDIGSRAEALVFLKRLYRRLPGFAPLFAHELPAAFARPVIRELLGSAADDDSPPPGALATLRMPILLLWGREDRLLPDTYLDYFARHLPPHAVIERPAFGHCPQVEAAALLAERIVAFARSAARVDGDVCAHPGAQHAAGR